METAIGIGVFILGVVLVVGSAGKLWRVWWASTPRTCQWG
jgi:hypothetical protein